MEGIYAITIIIFILRGWWKRNIKPIKEDKKLTDDEIISVIIPTTQNKD